MPNLEKLIVVEKKKFSLHWFLLWARTVCTVWSEVIDLRGSGISFLLWAKHRKIWKASQSKILRVHQISSWFGLSKTPENYIWTSVKDMEKGKKLLPKGPTYIALSPAANWDKKCWPTSHFILLAQQLICNKKKFPKLKIVILGTKKERLQMGQLFEKLPKDCLIDLMGKEDLTTISSCLSRCQLFVGNDSGLMHLAAASNTPTLGIFGPSPPEVYAPWGKKTETISLKASLSEIMKAVNRGENVMENISVESVYSKILTFI